MAERSEGTARVDASRVIELLERARVPGPTGLAFDADGTLWAGDVGEDVFDHACEHQLLREAPREGLARVARAHGLDASGSASDLGAILYAGYRRGIVDELLMCEMMTWGYAGFSVGELRALAHDALIARGLEARVRRQLGPILEFARREGMRRIVVSASPHVIVTEALRIAGIDIATVAAAHPSVRDGEIEPALRAPVPYGPEKPIAGRALLEDHDWLASFGDNAFDVEMLRIARIGVAVCPKPALVSRLGELTNTVVLE